MARATNRSARPVGQRARLLIGLGSNSSTRARTPPCAPADRPSTRLPVGLNGQFCVFAACPFGCRCRALMPLWAEPRGLLQRALLRSCPITNASNSRAWAARPYRRRVGVWAGAHSPGLCGGNDGSPRAECFSRSKQQMFNTRVTPCCWSSAQGLLPRAGQVQLGSTTGQVPYTTPPYFTQGQRRTRAQWQDQSPRDCKLNQSLAPCYASWGWCSNEHRKAPQESIRRIYARHEEGWWAPLVGSASHD